MKDKAKLLADAHHTVDQINLDLDRNEFRRIHAHLYVLRLLIDDLEAGSVESGPVHPAGSEEVQARLI